MKRELEEYIENELWAYDTTEILESGIITKAVELHEAKIKKLNKIYDHHEAQIKESKEAQMLTMQLCESVIEELKSEREIKDYLVKEFHKDKKKLNQELTKTRKDCQEKLSESRVYCDGLEEEIGRLKG